MGAGSKQVVRPPQRGIFPLDHLAECQSQMQSYVDCLQANRDVHHLCRELSKLYLQCRMDRGLMAKEDLGAMGYGPEQDVRGAREYDSSKERAGFVAGTHISDKESKWWWQR
jgi:cytochrome c oxidase assembly protein subunit 19